MPRVVNACAPILCAAQLRPVERALIELLRSLTLEQWTLPTIVPTWRVHDVVAHLADTALRKLSMVRDGHWGAPVAIHSDADLVAFVDRLNREGVAVYGRLSPSLLIDLLEHIGPQFALFHESLAPYAQAAFGVSWAGEQLSPNWFDTARELTERWHHQQQIRLAVHRPGLLTPELYHPVLDCFLRGLPHRYRDVAACDGSVVQVEVTGACGGTWLLARSSNRWTFTTDETHTPSARVVLPEELAWRLFTKGLTHAEAQARIAIEGDAALAAPVLRYTAIVG